MANLPLKLRHNKDPNTRYSIDWSNPIARKLRAAVFYMPNINAVYDSVSNKVYQGTSEILGIKDGEKSLKFDGANDYFKIPISGLGGEVTVIGKFPIETLSAASHLRGVTLTDSSTTSVRLSIGRLNASYPTWRVNNNDGSTNHIVDSENESIVDGIISTVATVETGASITKAYINGVADLGTSRAGTSNAGNLSFSGLDTLTLGAVTYSTGQNDFWENYISYALVFDRALSSKEIKSLYDNPYQILKPRTQFIDISVPLVGGGFQAAWVNNNHLIGAL